MPQHQIAPVASHPRDVKHITPKGRVLWLPEDTSEEEAARAVEATDAAPERSTAADMGVGALKSVARNALDLGTLAAKVDPVSNMFLGPLRLLGVDKALGIDKYLPGYVPPGTREALAPENDTQRYAGMATDAVSALVGPGMVSRGANLARSGARWLERSAVPMSDDAAEFVLKNSLGRVTQTNAAKLADKAAQTTYTLPSGVTKPIVGQKPYVQEAATAMAKAAGKEARPLWEDFAVGGGAYAVGGRDLAAAIAALKFLSRPGVKSTIAQKTYQAAPVLGATGAGVAGPAFRGVLDWLLREDK